MRKTAGIFSDYSSVASRYSGIDTRCFITYWHNYLKPEECDCYACHMIGELNKMSQKEQNKTDFTNKEEAKLLILVNEQTHSNWMNGKPLIEGNEGYAKTHPEDWDRLVSAYERMNEALGNPPINKKGGCCGGGCGCGH